MNAKKFTYNLKVQYSITVKTGYNPSKLKVDGIKVYTIKEDLYNIGLVKSKTTFDHTVRTFDMERTICTKPLIKRKLASCGIAILAATAPVLESTVSIVSPERNKNIFMECHINSNIKYCIKLYKII